MLDRLSKGISLKKKPGLCCGPPELSFLPVRVLCPASAGPELLERKVRDLGLTWEWGPNPLLWAKDAPIRRGALLMVWILSSLGLPGL